MDLFSEQHTYSMPEYTCEDKFREAVKKQNAISEFVVRERGIYPDWLGEPEPLSKDKARLLTVLYEQGFITWASSTCKENMDVVQAIGLQKEANAKAVLKDCLALGLTTSRIWRGKQIFELTHKGEHALHEYLLEKELGII